MIEGRRMTEKKLREIFAPAGWKVEYQAFKKDFGDSAGRTFRKARVVISSTGRKIIAGTTYREVGLPSTALRRKTFENAWCDLGGKPRPGRLSWVLPVGIGASFMPAWVESMGKPTVSSVEEFAFKLSALGF